MSKIHNDWLPYLGAEIEKDYYKDISKFLKLQEELKKTIFPPQDKIFRALSVPPQDIKIIIVGQDPYHNFNQANGLSFSVERGEKIPPSLQNIYKELQAEYQQVPPTHGDLTRWHEQGVLLLNTSLTVEKGLAGSHSKIGWQNFTDAIIRTLSDNFDKNVYILWGNHAKAKEALIDTKNNLILSSAHPSPFSATKFFGNNHFRLANAYLEKQGKKPVDWFDL